MELYGYPPLEALTCAGISGTHTVLFLAVLENLLLRRGIKLVTSFMPLYTTSVMDRPLRGPSTSTRCALGFSALSSPSTMLGRLEFIRILAPSPVPCNVHALVTDPWCLLITWSNRVTFTGP